MLDFSQQDRRRGFRSKKWTRFDENVLPLPVADMDCVIAEPIQQALSERVAHGIFGYDHPPENAISVFIEHCRTEYDWAVDPAWIVPVGGVVPAQFAAVRAFSTGGKVAIPNPIYHSFPRAPEVGNAQGEGIGSVIHDGREILDIPALGNSMAASENAGVTLLCNPHNPGGAVYSEPELQAIGKLAADHQNVLVSDEIWADLILDDLPHHPMAKVQPQWGISILAATKTWNIAGLHLAFVVIPNDDLRARFNDAVRGYPDVSYLAWIASTAAYEKGQPWRAGLLDHLRAQRERMQAFVDAHPSISMTRLQGTYLAWVDCRPLNRPNLHAECVAAGVGPDDGIPYGKPGFLRFNLACSEAVLTQALARFAEVIQ